MRRLLRLSLGLCTIMLSFLLMGCTEIEGQEIDFKFKSLEEYVEDINNITVEMEVIFQGQHSKYLFTNNSKVYVNSLTDPDGQEYGYVYDANDNTLYSIDRGRLLLDKKDENMKESVSKILSNSYLLFFTSLNSPKVSYEGQTIISGRNCHKYKATITDDYNKTYDYYLSIDDQTELCLRCNCISDNKSQSYFVTKEFINSPKTASYEQAILDYKLELQTNNK